MANPVLGPWEPELYGGYSSSYWTLRRRNSGWLYGIQRMTTRGSNYRRFKTQDAAQKAANAENATPPASPSTGESKL